MTQETTYQAHCNEDAPHEPRFYFSLQHNSWVLASNVYYKGNGIKLFIRKGFVTDLASVPFYVRPIINNTGRYNLAATVHDYLYEYKGVLPNGMVLPRKLCDKIFYDIMIDDGVHPVKAEAMWLAVRTWFPNSFRF